MTSHQNLLIINTIIDYYLWQQGKMPVIISPYEDADMVCCVTDKLIEGTFKPNVVYGRGEYFRKNIKVITDALKKSKYFKEVGTQESATPIFKYVGK